MNISKITVNLSGNDLLSIYKEFISIEGLNISEINIDNEISILGRLNKGFNIDFLITFKLETCEENIIKLQLGKIKVLNIGIFSVIRNMAVKYLLKSFKEKGIDYNKGNIEIQYKYLLKDIPYIDFDINSIILKMGLIEVDLNNVQVSIEGLIEKDIKLISKEKSKDIIDDEEFEKVKDFYTSGREIVTEKIPKNAQKYRDYIFIIPDAVALIYRLLKDKRVPMKTKIIISSSICYMAFPSDLIPDKIPFIGKIDDVAVIFFALNRIISDVPAKIILENWEGNNNIVVVLKTLAQYVTDFTGAKNVETIYSIIDEIVSL